jgi:hypothetical protein
MEKIKIKPLNTPLALHEIAEKLTRCSRANNQLYVASSFMAITNVYQNHSNTDTAFPDAGTTTPHDALNRSCKRKSVDVQTNANLSSFNLPQPTDSR